MNVFLEIYNLPKLNYEEIKYLNRPITSKEIESVIKNLQRKKGPGPDGFTAECFQTFNEELTLVLLKFLQKTEEEGKFANSFCVVSFTLIPKSDRYCKKENYRVVFL